MKRILLLVASSALLNCFILAQTSDVKPAGNSFSDSAEETIQASKKNAIRIYPNPSYGKLSVSSNKSTVLHFYIFDLEGTLVYQAVLTNKEKKNIDNLMKGTYIYDVFEKDLSIEEGRIIIK